MNNKHVFILDKGLSLLFDVHEILLFKVANHSIIRVQVVYIINVQI